ncbi:hypothetical protein Misp01_16840 [Microtetraspora sp. NBRC 13810]|nr:hypothetical protein Misp01_16840 [Microtetraspora sp. NBRC 13810]
MVDVFLALAGIVLDVLVSAQSWTAGGVPGVVGAAMSVAVGGSLGFLRRWPGPVSLYLSAQLVLTDQLGAYTANSVQILVPIALGVLANRGPWRWIVPAAVCGCLATALNMADPGIVLRPSYWFYAAGSAVLPVLIGRYLRGAERRLPDGETSGIEPDVLLAGAGVAISVLGTWREWHSGTLPVPVNGLLVMLAGLSLGVVRRVPGAVFLFQALILLVADSYAMNAADTLQATLMVTVAIFSMRASWGWTTVVYLGACAVTAITVVDDGLEVTAWRAFLLMTMVATPVAIGRYLRGRQRAGELGRRMAREAEKHMAARMRADRLAERERIARDVHDIVAHHVGAMVLRAGAAQYAQPPGPVADALTDIRATGHQVLEDLRGLLDVLRDPGPGDLPLADPVELLRDSVERVRSAGLKVRLELDPELAHTALVVSTSAARIVQEALTNVLKHAGPGTEVRVDVTVDARRVWVEVRNGPAAAPPAGLPSSGRGIPGMRERAGALGGTLSARQLPGGGWSLTASLPVAASPHRGRPRRPAPDGEPAPGAGDAEDQPDAGAPEDAADGGSCRLRLPQMIRLDPTGGDR